MSVISIYMFCPDQSSAIDPETDLRHDAPMLGNGRGPREGSQTHLLENWLIFDIHTLNPDVGDRDQTPLVGEEGRTSVVRTW